MAFSSLRVILGAAGSAGGGGDTGLIAGGDTAGNGTGHSDTIRYLTIVTEITTTDWDDLQVPRYNLAGLSNNTRGVWLGGAISGGTTNTIDFVTIATSGSSADFGDLSIDTHFGQGAGTGNGTSDRGIVAGFFGPGTGGRDNRMEYINVASTGDSSDFGNITATVFSAMNVSNSTNDRGITAGGYSDDSPYWHNQIDFVTISSTGDASEFGDLTVGRNAAASCSNATNERGVFSGGQSPNRNTIDFITINSTAEAADFGDLSGDIHGAAGLSNGVGEKGLICSGNKKNGGYVLQDNIEKITINSTGNSTDYGGDVIAAAQHPAGLSDAE